MADISPEQLEAMIERAAEAGAQKVLHSLGLSDDSAPQDVAELRSLLDSWRMAKRTMIKSAVGWLTVAVLTLLSLGAGLKIYHGDGG